MPFSSNSAADAPRAICGATNRTSNVAKTKSCFLPSGDVSTSNFIIMIGTLSGRCYRHITCISWLHDFGLSLFGGAGSFALSGPVVDNCNLPPYLEELQRSRTPQGERSEVEWHRRSDLTR